MENLSLDTTSTIGSEESELPPSHIHFDSYLPWACAQMCISTYLKITKVQKYDRTDTKSLKSTRSRIMRLDKNIKRVCVKEDTEDDATKKIPSYVDLNNILDITIVYDNYDNVVHLKLLNNKKVPNDVMKVISLIIEFQTYLTAITINRGLHNNSIYQLSQWLTKTNITDVCLDDTAVADSKYDILLENDSMIKNLSLSRCKIDDVAIKNIAAKLIHPLPASKTLCTLKLSSNAITDKGAKYLAKSLKTNRKLVYLNLSDNSISDDGFGAILDVLIEFHVSHEELSSRDDRRKTYMEEKAESLQKSDKYKGEKDDKKKQTKQTGGQSTAKKIKSGKDKDLMTLLGHDRGKPQVSGNVYASDKNKIIKKIIINEFQDPFSSKNIFHEESNTYCYGNNVLAYVNLAYNNISYLSVKKVLAVLIKQKKFDRKPRGLINLSIEGNNLPVNCEEYIGINKSLAENLSLMSGMQKIQPQKKTTSSN